MADTKVYLSGGRIQGASTDAIGAVDTLGTAVNGSNSGCVTSSDTPFYGETSVTFDDNDAAHLFGSTSSFAGIMKEDFTVTFWAKCTGVGNGYAVGGNPTSGWGAGSNPNSSPYAGNQGCVLCLGQISGAGNGFVISFDDNSTDQFFVCAGDGSNVPLNDTQNDGADTDDNYHLYMFHFDNTNEELRVYRDGSATPRDTTSYAQAVTSTSATTYDEMYMGRQNIDDVRYYMGELADVSIWKRLVTTAEFTQLWGTFEDNTSTATNSVKGVRADALTNQAGLLAHWKLDDLNFTNSAAATDKSKTSITNVPVGTRYEETDTRKIFRRKVGGEAQANNVFNATNYTWVTAGNSGNTITTGDDGTGQGVSAGGLSSYRRGKTTITSGNTKTFVWKFTWSRNSGDQANNSILTLANFDWADTTPSGDQKNIKFQTSNTDVGFWRVQTASASVTSTQNSDFLQAAGTTRYYTVTGDGTNWKAQSWSDSARTTDEETTGDLGFPSDWLTTDAIDNVTFGSFGTASSDFTVKDISVKWDSGTAETWVEKGTA